MKNVVDFNNPFNILNDAVNGNMKTLCSRVLKAVLTAAMMCLLAVPADADITLKVSTDAHNNKPVSFNWTITDFNNSTPSVSTTTPSEEIQNTAPTISGSLTDFGSFGGSESLSLDLYATNTWNSFEPDEGSFGTQIAELRVNETPTPKIRMFNSEISTRDSSLTGDSVALILEINTYNAGIVTLLDLGIGNGGGPDVANFIVWDNETDTFLTNQTGKASNLNYGDYTLTTGDIVVLGVDHDNGNGNFRLRNIQLDVTANVPEPSSYAFLAGLLAFTWTTLRRLW